MLEEILFQGLGELGLCRDKTTLAAFRRYCELLAEWNEKMNLTAVCGEDETALLHFLDCAALLPHIPEGSVRILDVGSGAGFPGLVLKILRPELDLTLLDSLQKRVRFQQAVCEKLGLEGVRCLHLRAEEAPPEMRESFQLVVSRAVARLNVLAELCVPFVEPGGCFLAMKGPAAAEELAEALPAMRKLGCGKAEILPCRVPLLEAERSAVFAKKTGHTPKGFPRRYAQIKKQPLA